MADWGSSTCSCGCRKPEAKSPGCPCKQCQPGPGIDFLRGFGRVARRNAALAAAGRLEDIAWVYVKHD